MSELTMESHDSAQILYDKIRQVANSFLHNAKTFPLEVLQLENPTYEQVAEIMVLISLILTEISLHTDPMLGQKATEYASLMRRMGKAITAGDEEELQSCVTELDKRSLL